MEQKERISSESEKQVSDLEIYFRNNDSKLIHKWNHYFDVYDRYFSQFRGREVVILEIGVWHGGSLQMWKHYFGDKAKIYGVDVNPRCKELEEENVNILIGSQTDKIFLKEVKEKIPPVDILIDDGGHTMSQQIVTFEELFGHVKDGGVYLCEDLHTSYWLRWGGGHKRRGTFIEYSKNFIDYLNAYHSRQSSLKPDYFTKNVKGIHYYDSMIVIEKQQREEPFTEKTGSYVFEKKKKQSNTSVLEKMRVYALAAINKVLQFLRLPGFIWK